MEYYILRNDSTGKNLFDLLSQKAKEGVEVRLLYDSVGGRHISKEQIEMLRRSGVKVAVFFGSTFPFFNFKINYRNHRKIVVIDGITGFVGGFNVGDEYLGLNKGMAIGGLHLKIRGCGNDLRPGFLDWGHAQRKSSCSARVFSR